MLHLSYNLKKGGTQKIPLPNLKNESLVPSKIIFHELYELEVTVMVQKNILIKCSEPYFRVFQEIDLGSYHSRFSEGEDLVLNIRNLSKSTLDLQISVEYSLDMGNLIFSNQYPVGPLLEESLQDLSDAGSIHQLILDCDGLISSVILDPIFKYHSSETDTPTSSPESDTPTPTSETDTPTPIAETPSTDKSELEEAEKIIAQTWGNTMSFEASEPTNRMVIDFTDPDLESYARYLKFYRLKVILTEETKKETGVVYLLGYGFK